MTTRDFGSLLQPLASAGIRLAEAGRLPDPLLRLGIRRLVAQRLAEERAADPEWSIRRLRDLHREWAQAPIAVATDAANAQHYEVPSEFFRLVLGPHLKYSCCHFPGESPSTDLASAEESALALTGAHAGLQDGMRILELGCGWGSLTLWMARSYPASQIVAVSNSKTQREHILGVCQREGLGNVEVVTADANHFEPSTSEPFDRVVSVEMFEHMRNWPRLFERIAGWLAPDGRFFMHVFCHRDATYPFEDRGTGDWMSRNFFSGGIMPSDRSPYCFPEHLQVEEQWRWRGTHYAATADAWLANLDARRERVLEVFREGADPSEAERQVERWRLFFLACSELFGFEAGNQWWVSHYLLKPAAGSAGASS